LRQGLSWLGRLRSWILLRGVKGVGTAGSGGQHPSGLAEDPARQAWARMLGSVLELRL